MIPLEITIGDYVAALERHRRLYEALEAGGALNTIEWRDLTLFDLSTCKHETTEIHYVQSDLGEWEVETCARCGEQVAKECTCRRLEWHLDGSVLVCALCGIDGT